MKLGKVWFEGKRKQQKKKPKRPIPNEGLSVSMTFKELGSTEREIATLRREEKRPRNKRRETACGEEVRQSFKDGSMKQEP